MGPPVVFQAAAGSPQRLPGQGPRWDLLLMDKADHVWDTFCSDCLCRLTYHDAMFQSGVSMWSSSGIDVTPVK